MAKRKRSRRGKARPYETRLPFPPPFRADQWGRMQLHEIVENPVAFEYFDKCLKDAIASGRSRRYLNVLVMIAHIGRLPEFDEWSYDKFLSEAHQQHFTESQLERALELIVQSSGPGEALPSAVEAFEFLAFVGDFVGHYAEDSGAGKRLLELCEHIRALGLMAFAVAVSVELGIKKDFWQE